MQFALLPPARASPLSAHTHGRRERARGGGIHPAPFALALACPPFLFPLPSSFPSAGKKRREREREAAGSALAAPRSLAPLPSFFLPSPRQRGAGDGAGLCGAVMSRSAKVQEERGGRGRRSLRGAPVPLCRRALGGSGLLRSPLIPPLQPA